MIFLQHSPGRYVVQKTTKPPVFALPRLPSFRIFFATARNSHRPHAIRYPLADFTIARIFPALRILPTMASHLWPVWLLMPVVLCGSIATWNADADLARQIMMAYQSKIYYSLCNSTEAPVFPFDDTATLELPFPIMGGTKITGTGYKTNTSLEVRSRLSQDQLWQGIDHGVRRQYSTRNPAGRSSRPYTNATRQDISNFHHTAAEESPSASQTAY